MNGTSAPSRPRPRPAHTQGTTRCAYTPDGSRLVTVGSNNTIRLYKTGSDGEPTNIDDCQEQNVSVAASNNFFVVGSEDGTVSLYSIENAIFDRFLLRTSLPIRDVALTPDSKWCAVASDELSVKVVNTQDISQIKHLREHNRAARNVSFDPNGRLAAVSCTDGIVYVYSMTAEEPELIRKVDGIIGTVDSDTDMKSTGVSWHPDGRMFAAVTPIHNLQTISKNDWEKQRAFEDAHARDITAFAWSPNGALLASADKEGKMLVWEAKSQSVVARYEFSNVNDMAWHPTQNIISFTTSEGEVYIHTDFLSEQFYPLLRLPVQPAPFIHDPLSEISGNRRNLAQANGQKPHDIPSRPRRESLGSLDSFLGGEEGDGEEDDFVVDDDGAGYTAAPALKRPWDGADLSGPYSNKRRHIQAQYHEAFQPGSTPWRGNRKYLCLNLIGFVWTVDQDSHHTVTVEFYDHEFHRDFHFTDTFLYDKACLNEKGTLFSCPPTDDRPATILYRPHETWTQRTDWRTELPKGETITAMSLSESFVTVTTSANYVRIFTLFGMPYRVYRPKSSPMVTCASWRDYVMTMGNGPVGPDGQARLLYTIENVKRDEICQNEDTVALPEGATLKSAFFSDNGVSCPIHEQPGQQLTMNRTHVSTTQPERCSHSHTGGLRHEPAGCHFWTQSCFLVSPLGEKTSPTTPSLWRTTSSTASSSRAATNTPTSLALSSLNSNSPSPLPPHQKRSPSANPATTTPCPTKTTNKKPAPKPATSSKLSCSRRCRPPSSATSSTRPRAAIRSARCSQGWSWRWTRPCCSCWRWSVARERRGG